MLCNKKIGMAINYDYPDYGGMLQAYASFRKIKELGYEVEAININCLSGDIRNRKLKYFAKNICDYSVVKEKSHILFKKLKIKTNKKLKINLNKRNKSFDVFCKEHFIVSKAYKSWDELSSACSKYAAVVVGSDQLWLPSNIAGDYYTLSFVPNDIKKIAYATSFGVSKIAKGQEAKAKEYLSRINYLSAREKSGQRIIMENTTRDVPLVCDPTLLFTDLEWNEEISNERFVEDKYIFCYFMGDNPWQRAFVKKLKVLTGYKIVGLLHLDQYIKTDEEYVDEAPYDVSPSDFVNLVKNAEIVCTDSFHGTVFSIIFGRKFFTFKRFSEKATLSTNTRIDSLLKYMDLEDRIVLENSNPKDMLNKNIDYVKVRKNQNDFRLNSLKYFTDALEA